MIGRTAKLQVLAFLVVSILGVTYVGVRYVGLGERLLGGGYVVHVDLARAGGIFPNAPVTYRGVLYTQGPTFEVTESCGDGSSTRTHLANNTWLLLDPGDELAVSADGRTISGVYRVETPFANSQFIQESTYTIVRAN